MGKLLAIAGVIWLLFLNGISTLQNLSGMHDVKSVAQTTIDGARRLTTGAPTITNPARIRALLDQAERHVGAPISGWPMPQASPVLSRTATLDAAAVVSNEALSADHFVTRPQNDTRITVDAQPAPVSDTAAAAAHQEMHIGAPQDVSESMAAAAHQDSAIPATQAQPAMVESAPAPAQESQAAPAVEQAPSSNPADKCAQSPSACASGG